MKNKAQNLPFAEGWTFEMKAVVWVCRVFLQPACSSRHSACGHHSASATALTLGFWSVLETVISSFQLCSEIQQ